MPLKKIRLLILGHGEMGQAMEFLLAPHHPIHIWQRRPAAGDVPVNLDVVVPASDVILYCLPATALAEITRRIVPHLKKGTLCLTIAKGLDDRGRLPFEVLAAIVGPEKLAVLYGPMISEEIRAGKPAFAECGAHHSEAHACIMALFARSALQIQAGHDIIGLSWSAVLKNVYAMAFGMADELDLGDNVRGLLSVAALSELSRMVQILGGGAMSPFHLAGLGDLITRATSAGSHHHDLGQQLARGTHNNLVGEGPHSLKVLREYPRFDPKEFSLFQLIDDCVQRPDNVRLYMANWLRSPFDPP